MEDHGCELLGPLIQGDVLVVDEGKVAQHNDPVIVEGDEGQRL